jgi:Restriction endonuclease XhoI
MHGGLVAERIRPEEIQKAVESFWFARDAQLGQLVDGGAAGGAARANRHLGGFGQLVMRLFLDAGVPVSSIKTGRPTLPGYYRVAKQWDLVVVYGNYLLAAIEFKSQVGSVGKNYNNRFEEALGSATDVQAAQQEYQAFGELPPWLAYVFVLQEDDETEKRRGPIRTLFQHDPEFDGLSYNQRYQMMIKRFISHEIYHAGWFLTTKRTRDGAVTYLEPLATACAATLAEAIAGRVNVVRAAVEAGKRL